MDENFEKCMFLTFFLSLKPAHVVSLSVIEAPPIILIEAIRPLSCLSREIVAETANRALG